MENHKTLRYHMENHKTALTTCILLYHCNGVSAVADHSAKLQTATA